MLHKTLFCSLFMLSGLALELQGANPSAAPAQQQQAPNCGQDLRSMRGNIRHKEANGVGYNTGYSTFDAFFSPDDPLNDKWVPFLDLRGHLFNNGMPAANGGLGLRYISSSRVWGFNTYYDYRRTTHRQYHQVGLGLESLGEIWDFRINGYLPVWTTRSSYFRRAQFYRFKDNSMILTRTREIAFNSVDAEIGAHVDGIINLPFYFAAGPYYLQGHGKTAWGGRLRATVDFFNHIRLEGNVSYDNLFKWVGQGQMSLVIPFKKMERWQKKKECVNTKWTLRERSLQRVDRSEIIPTDHKRVNTKAIDPTTGRPYTFWFVNNTSQSNGTFESPFHTLTDAQNASAPHDVIYVFTGDGTSKGMDVGITLKDNQRLFGAGIVQTLPTTLGLMTIPVHSNGIPVINNINLEGAAVTLANNNEISGLHIISSNFGSGIVGGTNVQPSDVFGIINTNIHNNLITNITATSPSIFGGIVLSNCTGNLIIENNTFSDINLAGVNVINTSTIDTINSNLRIANNTFTNIGQNGINVIHESGKLDFCMLDNTLVNINSSLMSPGVGSILLGQTMGNGIACGTISGNKIDTSGKNSIYIISSAGNINVEVTENTAKDTDGFFASSTGSGNVCLGLYKNSDADDFTLEDISLESTANDIGPVEDQNDGDFTTFGTITFVPPGDCDCGSACK